MASKRRKMLLGVVALLLSGAAVLGLSVYRDSALRLLHGARPGLRLEGIPVGGMYSDEVRDLVQELALDRYVPPVDASIDRQMGRIYPEMYGMAVDVAATLKRVMEAEWKEAVAVQFVPLTPAWQERDLARLTKEAGKFATEMFGSRRRQFNLRLAAQRLGYTLLFPGEEFSFNETVGPYTPETGWQSAPVISGGRLVPGLAGGICQVSTTVYNAVRRARLSILERHPHTMSVPYVPSGYDAAVSMDKDLRFRNNFLFPVLMRVWIAHGRLYATVFRPDDEKAGEEKTGAGVVESEPLDDVSSNASLREGTRLPLGTCG